jgi:tRNA(Ile)-lysidine synthase
VQQQFLNHIEKNALCLPGDRILLAVSGGIDSMVMLSLFQNAGFRIGVAHCNFQLRGKESDSEERHVKLYCEARSIPFYSERMSTIEFAEEQKFSIQVAARELRYAFFESVRSQHGYQFIATAHHLTDSIETVLLNLTRGTGIDGITGIPVRNGLVIRPLLFCTRQQIVDYANAMNLNWCSDSSNDTDHYARNIIRHHVVPLLTSLNPDLEDNLSQSIERFAGTRWLATQMLGRFKSDAIRHEGDVIKIQMGHVLQSPHAAVVLWECLKQMGFRYDECKSIIVQRQPGKSFFSQTHRLVVDRTEWLVTPRISKAPLVEEISEDHNEAQLGAWKILLSKFTRDEYRLDTSPAVGQFDLEKIVFPLKWRSWNPGDSFSPLGMQAKKKVSDFLIDNKFSLVEKEEVTVMQSGEEIIWIVGIRISDRFKITSQTRRILKIAVENR